MQGLLFINFTEKTNDMSKEKLGNSPAFPTDYGYQQDIGTVPDSGMSKRFYAACAAMQGLLANADINGNHNSECIEWISRHAFMQADELLKTEQENF